MANPNFPSDGQGERIDALVDETGVVHLKAALGSIVVTGADDPSAAHLVGTHLDAATAGSTDPLVLAAGLNGTTVRHLAVDASGRIIVVGQDDVGSGAPTVPPFLAAGYDGSDIQYLTVGTDGRLQVVGSVAIGSAVSGAVPVIMAGQDGTSVRVPRTDGNSYWQHVRGGYTDGASTFFAGRIPNVFKTAAVASSGDNSVWTPTSGKKFRLMGYQMSATTNITTSGGAVITAKIRDNATDIGLNWQFYAPSAAVTTVAGGFTTGWVWLGDSGYLSSAANQIAKVNLSAATTGSITVNMIGTEE
jgi:hypothetical protein